MRTNDVEAPAIADTSKRSPVSAILVEPIEGKVGNRLQAIMNLTYLLGRNESVTGEVRLIVTHIQAEVAMLQCLLAESYASAKKTVHSSHPAVR